MKPDVYTIGINLISCESGRIAGTGKYMKRIFSELANIDLEKYFFYIYIQSDVNESVFCIPNNMNFTIIRVPKLNSGFLRNIFINTFFYLYIKKCNVMYSPVPTSVWFGRHKKIITILDFNILNYPSSVSMLTRIKYKVACKLADFFSDKIITISENTKNDIIKFLRTNPSKIETIYCFISSKEINIINENISLYKINLENETTIELIRPYLLSVSTLQPTKNFKGLIKAFKIFHSNHPEYKLYVVGQKGWKYEDIFDEIDNDNIQKDIILTGYISDKDLNTLYSHCEGVVFVSFCEGFGYSPLEGFYHNKLCIASNKSSIPEVVGNAGLYVDPYNIESIAQGMERLLSDKEKLIKYIPNQIRKFEPKPLITRFIKVLSE